VEPRRLEQPPARHRTQSEPVGRNVQGRIETDRWYEIKIELAGNRIRCYLDGAMIQEATAPATEHFYAVAGRDEVSGDLVIKAINTAAEPVGAKLTLQGVADVKPDASATVLTSADLSDNNNLDSPMGVAPVESRINTVSGEFQPRIPGPVAHSSADQDK